MGLETYRKKRDFEKTLEASGARKAARARRGPPVREPHPETPRQDPPPERPPAVEPERPRPEGDPPDPRPAVKEPPEEDNPATASPRSGP